MRRFLLLVPLLLAAVAGLHLARAGAEPPEAAAPARTRVPVPKALIRHDDGDSFLIRWPAGDEIVRVLGVDTPETAHPEHDIPYAQPFGEAAAGFLRGCLAVAKTVEILRADEKDPYDRTLAYLFLDDHNYSVLVLENRLAVENVGHFGDNGFPHLAADVLAAARRSGPAPFEPPHRFRARMRKLAAWARGEADRRAPSTPVESVPSDGTR